MEVYVCSAEKKRASTGSIPCFIHDINLHFEQFKCNSPLKRSAINQLDFTQHSHAAPALCVSVGATAGKNICRKHRTSQRDLREEKNSSRPREITTSRSYFGVNLEICAIMLKMPSAC